MHSFIPPLSYCWNIINTSAQSGGFTAREFNNMANVKNIYIYFFFALTDARARVSVDLPRRNINVIDILLRASIKEKHRGWMKYAAFPGARAFQLALPPPEYVRRNARKEKETLNVAARPAGRRNGIRWRREKCVRVNLTGAAWRGRHVASIPRFWACTSAGQRVRDHLTVSTDGK